AGAGDRLAARRLRVVRRLPRPARVHARVRARGGGGRARVPRSLPARRAAHLGPRPPRLPQLRLLLRQAVRARSALARARGQGEPRARRRRPRPARADPAPVVATRARRVVGRAGRAGPRGGPGRRHRGRAAGVRHAARGVGAHAGRGALRPRPAHRGAGAEPGHRDRGAGAVAGPPGARRAVRRRARRRRGAGGDVAGARGDVRARVRGVRLPQRGGGAVVTYAFDKLYADLVADDGTVCIVYLTRTEIFGTRHATATVELYTPNGKREVVHARRAPAIPDLDAGAWTVELDVPGGPFRIVHTPRAGGFTPAGSPAALTWAVTAACADVEARWLGDAGRGVLRGRGYADRVTLHRIARRLGLRRVDW